MVNLEDVLITEDYNPSNISVVIFFKKRGKIFDDFFVRASGDPSGVILNQDVGYK